MSFILRSGANMPISSVRVEPQRRPIDHAGAGSGIVYALRVLLLPESPHAVHAGMVHPEDRIVDGVEGSPICELTETKEVSVSSCRKFVICWDGVR